MSSKLSIEEMIAILNTIKDAPQFPRFAKLPTELRLMCWRAALPGPRIITISVRYTMKNEFLHRKSIATYDVPVLLSINKESRQVAQAAYEQQYSQHLNGNAVYIDLSKDALLFDCQFSMFVFFGFHDIRRELRAVSNAPLSMTRVPKVIALADQNVNGQNSIIRGTSSCMRKLAYPERIAFLRKQANVRAKHARVAEGVTDAWNKFARDRDLAYKGPVAEEWILEQLEEKLVSTYFFPSYF